MDFLPGLKVLNDGLKLLVLARPSLILIHPESLFMIHGRPIIIVLSDSGDKSVGAFLTDKGIFTEMIDSGFQQLYIVTTQ